MPLSLFNHRSQAHFREVSGADSFGHTFGGDTADFGLKLSGIESPPHLLYRLNLDDPALNIVLPGVQHLPLLYWFSYAYEEGRFLYRITSDSTVEIVSKADWPADPDFPYEQYPLQFPLRPVAFEQHPYDPTVAEDALRLAGIFRLDQLSKAELQRAIQIADAEGFFEESALPGWTLEERLVITYDAPFRQGRPSRQCDNENCTAKVTGYTAPSTIKFSAETCLAGETLELPGRAIREDSMRVFAIHQPHPTEKLMWGDPLVQMIFEFCESCHCVRVSNQCT